MAWRKLFESETIESIYVYYKLICLMTRKVTTTSGNLNIIIHKKLQLSVFFSLLNFQKYFCILEHFTSNV